jgi:hypothetical protein
MKKLVLSTILFLVSAVCAFAYTTVTISGEIRSSATWTADKQYLLKGYVYVTSGTTLTINAGTIIKGDRDTKGALIIERGAKIFVKGTATSPVIFTSNQPAGSRNFGDWGGLIICGAAPNNWLDSSLHVVEGGPRSQYGGTDPNDNSGSITYCRIEFSGIAFSPNNEVNALSLYGVGAGTEIHHVQTSYCGDDSYEWFGGNVNAKYLVSYNTWDDDFDVDNGYNGRNQFLVSLRNPYAADQSGSKAFEMDSYQSGTKGSSASGSTGVTDTNNMTKCVFSNVTAIGPVVNPSSSAYDPYFVAAAHFRRGTGASILNSIFAGWPCGVLIDESSSSFASTVGNIGSGMLQFRNNIVAGTASWFTSGATNRNIMFVKDGARNLTPTGNNADSTSSTGADWSSMTGFSGPSAWMTASANANRVYTFTADVRLQNPYNLTNPSFLPTSTSPVVFLTRRFASWTSSDNFDPSLPISYDTTSPATYNVPTVPPNFETSKAMVGFDKVNFVGAFKGTGLSADNWMANWTNFDPNDEPYDTVFYTVNSVTTIGAASSTNAVVFPNPAQDNATLMIDVKNIGEFRIAILDMTGKMVKEIFNGQLTEKGNNSIAFSTEELSNGVYFVTILGQNSQKTIRFSVAK